MHVSSVVYFSKSLSFSTKFCLKYPWLFGGYLVFSGVFFDIQESKILYQTYPVFTSVTYPRLSEAILVRYPEAGSWKLQDICKDFWRYISVDTMERGGAGCMWGGGLHLGRGHHIEAQRAGLRRQPRLEETLLRQGFVLSCRPRP
jgi:hypothetical protein